MKILYTTRDKWFSNCVRGVLKEPVSHVAIEFSIGIVVHSDFYGVHIEWAKNFRDRNQIVLELTPSNSPSNYDNKFRMDRLFKKHEGRMYDIAAMTFLGLNMLGRNYLGLPLSKKNLWQSAGMDICTEWVTGYIDDQVDSMITPYQHYLKLKASGRWN